MSSMILAIKAASISVSLVAAGGIATLSLFDIPELQAQPASRSLPSIRWLFSRGSHVFPTASLLSSAGFAVLAYSALPAQGRILTHLLALATNSVSVNGYLGAAVLTLGIAPWTSIVMIPTNFALIEKNERMGGARSEASTNSRNEQTTAGLALDSVNGKGQAPQFTDLSGPQTKTTSETSEAEDQETRELLGKFGRLNLVRAILIGAGGVVGLLTALST